MTKRSGSGPDRHISRWQQSFGYLAKSGLADLVGEIGARLPPQQESVFAAALKGFFDSIDPKETLERALLKLRDAYGRG
jgi:hypothetical protein